jgi:hypothetical protein
MYLSRPEDSRRAGDDVAISRLWAGDVAGRLRETTPEQAADLVGREFEFGAPVGIERWRSYPAVLVLGWLLGVVAALGMIIVALDPNAGGSEPDVLGCLAIVLLAGVFMIAVGARRRVLRGWLARYQDGYAQFLVTDPGPRVVRWSGVAEVTVTFRTTTVYTGQVATTSTHVHSFSARPFIGRLAPEVGQQWESWRLLTDAVRVVGPRLVPAMIMAYEAGRVAAFGPVGVDQHGVTVPGPGTLVPWPDIRSIRMRHVDLARGGRVVRAVHLSCRGKPGQRKIEVSGLPNGIFLPRVIAHAAARHGVPVKGKVI